MTFREGADFIPRHEGGSIKTDFILFPRFLMRKARLWTALLLLAVIVMVTMVSFLCGCIEWLEPRNGNKFIQYAIDLDLEELVNINPNKGDPPQLVSRSKSH